MLGNGILFSQTDVDWRKRRTAISPAFYKGKLVKLFEMAKSVVLKTNQRWRNLSAGGRTRISFMDEVSRMHVSILLKCAFGTDLSEEMIDFEHESKVEKKTLSYALRTTFHECINRMADPHIVVFPFLADIYITLKERAVLRNCHRLRNFIL